MNREPEGKLALVGPADRVQNLIFNLNDHSYTVAAYNRTRPGEKIGSWISG